MMRKLTFRNIMLVSSVCLTLAIGISAFAYYNVPGNVIKVHGDHALYNSIEQLESYSDAIIVAKAVDDFSKYAPTLTYTQEGRINTYNTTVDIQVVKSIKGSLNKGDVIKVIEHAAYLPSALKKTPDLTINEDVTLFQKGSKYILMLKKSEDGSYSVISLNQGKFNIDSTDLQEKQQESNNLQFGDLKKKIKAKYNSEFN